MTMHTWLYSHGYGAAMRVLHAFGLHWHKQSGPTGKTLWCHWCGDRRAADV